MIIKLPTRDLSIAAAERNQTPEEYIAESRSLFSGHKVCAHFEGYEQDGAISVFSLV